jgi:UDP-N-acetylmuramate dehydrogenase
MVRAGAALGLPVLARRAVEAGARGLEWAVGVPGSVGGALRMNAGGHGSDVAASLRRYGWMDLTSDAQGEDGVERLAPGYRSSSIGPAEVVLWAEFAATAGSVDDGRAEIAQIVRWRRANQPGGSNAGSVFTNPPETSAGALVDGAGLKGMRLGSAQVSTKHANFIQADEGGSADDVWRLIGEVRRAVAQSTGVLLATEVRLVGFDDEPGPVPT